MKRLADGPLESVLDPEKHSLSLRLGSDKIGNLRLPLPFTRIFKGESLASYLDRLSMPFAPYSIILVQAEYSALGFFVHGECENHRALRTYAIRRKQGMSEMSYRKKGNGGGTAGSQLRLRNGLRLFEKIHATLNEWKTTERSSRILYSCPVNLQNLLFGGVLSALGKDDPRLQKIPLDVRLPNYKELQRINKAVTAGYLTTAESDRGSEVLRAIIGKGCDVVPTLPVSFPVGTRY